MLRPNLAPFPRCGPSWWTTSRGQRIPWGLFLQLEKNCPIPSTLRVAQIVHLTAAWEWISLLPESCSWPGLWGFTWPKHGLSTCRFLELCLQCRSLLSENLSQKFWCLCLPQFRIVWVTTVPICVPLPALQCGNRHQTESRGMGRAHRIGFLFLEMTALVFLTPNFWT